MKLVKIRCSFCPDSFERSRGQINEAKKFSWKQFCSLECLAKSKLTGKNLTCSNKECDKGFYRPLKEIRKVQQSFCSRTCAAKVNNKLRTQNYPSNHCIYSTCKAIIPNDQKYCSRLHSSLSRKISKETFEKKFIERIKNFYAKHGRIPVKREMYGPYREAREFYGSWNKAIGMAGFVPNPVMFAKRYTAWDGHKCDSLAEKVIDDWLTNNKISHKRGVPYPAHKALTADFMIGKIWIEFFGLAGVLPKYDALIRQKRRLARKYKLNLIELYPKDLFPKNNLATIINEYVLR